LGTFGNVWERNGTNWHELARLGTNGHVWEYLGMFGQLSSLNPLILNPFPFPEH
jgi:hypothetical protein